MVKDSAILAHVVYTTHQACPELPITQSGLRFLMFWLMTWIVNLRMRSEDVVG